MKKLAFISLIYAVTALPTVAAETDALTLQQAQQIALAHYPQIAASEQATRAAKQDIHLARSDYLPHVDANAVRAFADDNTRMAAIGGLNNPSVLDRGAAGVGVSQLIYDFGRTTDRIDAAQAQFEAQKARGDLTRGTVLLNVTRAYYNLCRAQELLTVAQSTLTARKTMQDQIGTLRNAKLKSDLDASIANQSVGEANLLVLQAQNGVADAQAILSEALGDEMPQNHRLVPAAPDVPSPPTDLETLKTQAVENNPELAALKASEDAAKKRADAASATRLPTLRALGYAGATPIRSGSMNDTDLAGGITLSIPLYSGGAITAEASKADAQARIASLDTDMRKHQLLRDVQIAFGTAQTAYQNISVTKDIAKNAAESLDLTQARYGLGSSSIVDLNQAQLAQTQAQMNATNATYEYLIARAILDYQTGALTIGL